MKKLISDFLLRLSGHSSEVASQVSPAERIRIEALGMTLLLPVLVSGMGAGGVAYQVFGGNTGIAIAAALIIGTITLIIDRALLSSPANRFGPLLLRIVLTLVTSTVFAHSALLFLFAEKIDEAARVAKLEEFREVSGEASSLKKQMFESEDKTSIAIVTQLEVLTSDLKQVSRLIEEGSERLRGYQSQYDAEIEGRSRSKSPGEGPESRRIQRELIEPAREALAGDQVKYSELLALIDGLHKQLVTLRGNKQNDNVQSEVIVQLNSIATESLSRPYRGILTRFVLLHEIIRKDGAALAAYVVISALLLLWELLPVMLKLSGTKSEYSKQEAFEAQRAESTRVAEGKLFGQMAELETEHEMRMSMMRLEREEIDRWTREIEKRFEEVQAKRSAIPKRATPEQREAYLTALDVLLTSLVRVGQKLESNRSCEKSSEAEKIV